MIFWFTSYIHSTNIIKHFLAGHFQIVILKGKSTTWVAIEAETPQDSILQHLLFLVY